MALSALSALAADYGDDDDDEGEEQDKKDIVKVEVATTTTTTTEKMDDLELEVDKKVEPVIVKKVEISKMEEDKNEIGTALAIVVKKEDKMEEDKDETAVVIPPLLEIVKKEEGDEKNGADTPTAAIMPPPPASSPFTTFRNKKVTDDVDTEDSEPDSALDSDDDTPEKGKKSDKKQTGNSDDADLSSSDEEYDLSNAKSKVKKQPPRVKGEMNFDDLPPIQDLTISVPRDKAKPIAVIKSVVDPLVIVEAFPSTPALDLDSVLFLDQGDRALGHVFDVMGPVKQPWYCVRFNSMVHIEANGVTVGSLVYCAPSTQHASFVLLAQLEKMRGTDASWKDDIEPPLDVQEFSDDEKEREVKKKGKKRKVRVRAGGMHQNPPPSNGSAAPPPPRPYYNPRPPHHHHQRPTQHHSNSPNYYGPRPRGPRPTPFEYEQYLTNLTATNYYRPPQQAYFPRQPDYSWHTHPAAAMHGGPLPPPPPPHRFNTNPYQHFNPPSVPWQRQQPPPPPQQQRGGRHAHVPPLPPGTSS